TMVVTAVRAGMSVTHPMFLMSRMVHRILSILPPQEPAEPAADIGS
ncbi:hypothetical protein GGI1_24796, partial [Acidithiobacillus sp. GGI-221]